MYADNLPVPSSKDQWDYVQSKSNNLRTTFDSLSTVFSPACIAHEVLLEENWISVQVDGITLPDALDCWASSLPRQVPDNSVVSDEGNVAGAPSALELKIESQPKSDDLQLDMSGSSYNDVFSINSKSPSMLADAPRITFDYKLASNHLRKFVSPTERAAEQARNSISNRVHERRRHHKVVHNRTDQRRISGKYKYSRREQSAYSSMSFEREERRRKRKRLQRRLEKCRNGDEDICEKLRRRHGKEMFEDDPLNGGAGKGKLKQNSDLVRSLDRRSSRKGNSKHNPDRRKRKTAKQRNLEKHRARRLRKQQRKQKRRDRRRRKRERKRRRQQKLSKKKQQPKKSEVHNPSNNVSHQVKISLPVSSAEGEQKHHLKVRSVQESPHSSTTTNGNKSSPKSSTNQGRQCRAKLVDNCSWPHCNRSCPKLKNPETGKLILDGIMPLLSATRISSWVTNVLNVNMYCICFRSGN